VDETTLEQDAGLRRACKTFRHAVQLNIGVLKSLAVAARHACAERMLGVSVMRNVSPKLSATVWKVVGPAGKTTKMRRFIWTVELLVCNPHQVTKVALGVSDVMFLRDIVGL
jgi:hypothetical protein